MLDSVKKEVEQLMEKLDLNCSIRKFIDYSDWEHISQYQVLSESFIREFKNKVDWILISIYQTLSEEFIKEFKDEVDWDYIYRFQKLSEPFIREFKDKVSCTYISIYQNISEDFIKEFQDKINIDTYNKVHKTLSYEEKLQKVKEYCEQYNLELDETNKCFYAYRKHDEYGRGVHNKTIFYEKGKYYKDWRLDMREDEICSFGLGISNNGNTKVKVLIDDFGVRINGAYAPCGMCRVWGFEIVD